MTNFKASHENGIYHIEVDGHATGSDEVCAGVSSLCYALLGYAENSSAIILKSMNIHDGHFDISFKGGIGADSVYEMTIIGLLQIAETYPEYCRGAIV